jgi:hypothetical protein
MDDSMYAVLRNLYTTKNFFEDNFSSIIDYKILIGEKLSHHIFVGVFAKTKDGKMVVEIPRSLKGLQTEILASPYANKLKTRQEISLLLEDSIP